MCSSLIINCDMGEWDAPHLQNNDAQLMQYIDIANIACGGHAGNHKIIFETLKIALDHNVKVGPHPGYEDRSKFGRTYVQMSKKELKNLLAVQCDRFYDQCAQLNAETYHLKAHGALYHAVNHNDMESDVLIEYILETYGEITLFVSPNSLLESKAKAFNIRTMSESFIDRRYTPNLRLESRTTHGSVITNIDEAYNQYKNLANGIVSTTEGTTHSLNSQTACIHGDNPSALEILRTIKSNQ